MCGMRSLWGYASYRSGYLRLRHAYRICRCSSHSTSDSGSSDASNNAVDRTLPGSAIRARKSAAAKKKAEAEVQQESAEQMLDEKLTSAVDNITKSLPRQQRSQTRSELLQKLAEHSHADNSRAASASFTSVFAGMRVDSSSSSTKLTASKFTPKVEPPRMHPAAHPRPRRPSSAQQEIVTGVTQLFQAPALGIFSAGQKTKDERGETRLTLFDKLEAEESKHLTSLPPSNAFEEMMHWTEEGKLWNFPIDNEQGLDEEAKVGFHEHIFLEQLIDDRFPASGPVRHFMELVAVGLSKSPYLTVAEKHAHIAWYAEYFKDKYELIEQSQAAAAAAAAAEQQQSMTDAATSETEKQQ